jgi:sugar diacid utilization regulator
MRQEAGTEVKDSSAGVAVAPIESLPAFDADALHTIVERVNGQLEAIARRMIVRYREEIVDYKLVPDDLLEHDVFGVSLSALRVTMANIEAGRQPSAEELEETQAGASRRVHQNVSLESFLHAWRLWGQTVWQTVLACADPAEPNEREAALYMAGKLLEHLDLHSTAAAQGFLGELQSMWSDREVVRRDLLDALIAGDGDSDRVRRLARSLRLKLRDDYIVVIVRGQERPAEESPEGSLTARVALRRMAETVRARLRPSAGSLLVGMRHGEIVALYPFDEPEELEAVKRAGCQVARALDSHDARVGVSGVHRGLAQLSRACSEATEAVEIAVQTAMPGRVVAFDDVLIDSIIRSSRHAEHILDSTIKPLQAYDLGRRAELVGTLRAYIESGFNLAKSAEILCVHPNTVVYRLGRIKEISGRDPHSPDDLLLLQLGLKLLDSRVEH